MSNAALELLKNGMAQEPEPMESEEIDIDKLKTHSQINKVVEDYGLEVPDNWGALSVADKKKYLNETYGDESEDADEPEEETPVDDQGDEQDPDEGEEVQSPEIKEPEVEIPEPTEEPKAGDSLKAMMEQVETTPESVEEPVEPPKATKEKGKAKKDKPALDDAATAPSEVEDFTNVVQAIENMDRDTSLKAVDELSEQSGYAMFKLGGLFARIKSQGWFDPFDSFEEWVQSVHGMAKRKAQYSISIYESLVNSEIPFEKCKGVKWSKLKEIAPVMDKDTADLWIEKAKNLSVTNLIEEVKAHKKAAMAAISGEQADGSEIVKKVITRSFKLYEDQAEVVETAISKAKAETGADENNQALEVICLDYLSSTGKGVTVNKKDLASAIKEVGFEKAIEMVAAMFPEHDITIG